MRKIKLKKYVIFCLLTHFFNIFILCIIYAIVFESKNDFLVYLRNKGDNNSATFSKITRSF